MNAELAPPHVTVLTGASGWLGRALIAALIDTRSALRVLVQNRSQGDSLRRLGAHVSPVIGDIADPQDVARLFAGVTGTVDVLHAAGVIHPASVDQFDRVNVEGTRAVVRAAIEAGVRRMVHVSSNSPFGTNSHPGDRFRDDEPYHPYMAYGRSKMHAELAVLDAVDRGLNAVIVRPPWFYGPFQPARQTTFFSMVRRGMFPVFGDGGQQRSMVYIDNLVHGVLRAELVRTPPGRSWWIADRAAYSVDEIVATVGEALRDEGFSVRPNRFRVPNLVGTLAERADALIQRTGRYQQQVHVLGEMNKHIACSIEGARRELGYEPRVALYDGMRASIRWCRDEGIEL